MKADLLLSTIDRPAFAGMTLSGAFEVREGAKVKASIDTGGNIIGSSLHLPNIGTIQVGTAWGAGNLSFQNGPTIFGTWGATGFNSNVRASFGAGVNITAGPLQVGGGNVVDSSRNVSANSLTLNSSGTQPACDSTQRGKQWLRNGGPGVSDRIEVCLKGSADSYSWVTMVSAP